MSEKKIKILLAEDDENLGGLLSSYLKAKGYYTVLCVNGKDAYIAFEKESFDICIFDIMMPIKDGITLAKEIRKIDKKTPIILLTAKSMKEDQIEGFESGVDDYITKPFSMEILLLRVKALIKRIYGSDETQVTDTIINFGGFLFNYKLQELSYLEGEIHKLTSKEADLLKLLCENINNVVDRGFALNRIWGDDSYFNARSMDVYVTKLRKFLKEDPDIEILNIHGKGFKLVTK
ncbi:MAG: response regulator transcription factor [Bacteroidota bacterium]